MSYTLPLITRIGQWLIEFVVLFLIGVAGAVSLLIIGGLILYLALISF